MFSVTVLASGSSGNALLVRAGGCAVLVDAGLSAKRLADHLEDRGLRAGDLAGILLTHEHGDHTRGLKVLCGKNAVPIFATPLTAESLRRSGVVAEWNLFSSGAAFALGALEVLAFPVPHDAADPVGFVLRHGGRNFAVLTDLGFATRQVVECVRGVDGLLIETNHDEELLQKDKKRPWSVKQRILSRHGHLSNAAAAGIVSQIATATLRHVILGHLSQDCNSSELASRAVGQELESAGHREVTIHCAPSEGAGPHVTL